MQKLILPINHLRVTASWKTEAYRIRFGVVHYGLDCVSSAGSNTVYASGSGEVLAAGWDGVFGNVVVAYYPQAWHKASGKIRDVVLRYFHFALLAVKRGQILSKDTVLGRYGATGQLVSGAHLHLECDTDTNRPFYTPSLSGQSTFFRGRRLGAGDQSMQNPLEWLHCKASPPDSQTFRADANSYVRAEDRRIETIR